jgi:radical SAM superfamily enzyme YgiQ (UPF0313 family)
MVTSIALIEPPAPYFLCGYPLGLASLAAVVERDTDCSACVLDFQTYDDWGEVKRVLRDECALKGVKIFGIRILTPTYLDAKKLISIIVELVPDATIIVGGPHPSADAEQCLTHNPDIDVVALGEGERTLVDVLAALKRPADVKSVRGIVYRSAGGAIIRTAPRPLMSSRELGELPVRYERYAKYEHYLNNDNSAIMVTSRGCRFGCSFCSAARFWGDCRYRPRPVDHVMAELEYLVLDRKIRRIYFEDAIFNYSKPRVMELCDRITARQRDNTDFKFTWRPPCRVDLLDGEMLARMKTAGCTDIFFGLEAFDERQLKAVKGGVAGTHSQYRAYIAKVKEVFAACRETGIGTIAAMILGLPYEDEAAFEANIDMLREIRPDKLTFSVLSLYAGAPLLHEYAREPGYEWLAGLLEKENLFEIDFESGEVAEQLNRVSVHGPRAIKPRYISRERYLNDGVIEHDIEKILRAFARYKDALGDMVDQSLSIDKIREDTASRNGRRHVSF